jgi:hypothetical protein
LSHEPFLLVITRLSISAGSNDSNTLADRFRAVRPPLLVRCDNALKHASSRTVIPVTAFAKSGLLRGLQLGFR